MHYSILNQMLCHSLQNLFPSDITIQYNTFDDDERRYTLDIITCTMHNAHAYILSTFDTMNENTLMQVYTR